MTHDELVADFNPANPTQLQADIAAAVLMYRDVLASDASSPPLSIIHRGLRAEIKRLEKAAGNLDAMANDTAYTFQIRDPIELALRQVRDTLETLEELEGRWPKTKVANNVFRFNFNAPMSHLARICRQAVADHYRGSDPKGAYLNLAEYICEAVTDKTYSDKEHEKPR